MIKIKKLDGRLAAIAEMICGGVIADVGSDHAYLPIWLYLNKKIKKAYALDISENCVERIRANIKKYDITPDIIIPVLSDGLAGLAPLVKGGCRKAAGGSDEITDIIIAGMGGINIAEILAAAFINVNGAPGSSRPTNLILQPNSKLKYLRDFLHENNFDIIQEIKVESKKRFYNIINARLYT